jgi:hypothetical protein
LFERREVARLGVEAGRGADGERAEQSWEKEFHDDVCGTGESGSCGRDLSHPSVKISGVSGYKWATSGVFPAIDPVRITGPSRRGPLGHRGQFSF